MPDDSAPDAPPEWPCENGPFTVESLREMFEKEVIRPGSNRIVMPDDDDLDNLRAHLNWQWNWINAKTERLALKEMIEKAAEESKALAERLEFIARNLSDPRLMYELDGAPTVPALTAAIANLHVSAMLLQNVEHSSDEPRGAQWKRELLGLMQLFKRTMRRNNTTENGDVAGCGTGEQTPLTRFICAIIPKLTGDPINPGSVAPAVSKERNQFDYYPHAKDRF